MDLAKDIFEVAIANRAGRVVERKRLTRRQFDGLISNLTAGTEVIIGGVWHRALLGPAV